MVVEQSCAMADKVDNSDGSFDHVFRVRETLAEMGQEFVGAVFMRELLSLSPEQLRRVRELRDCKTSPSPEELADFLASFDRKCLRGWTIAATSQSGVIVMRKYGPDDEDEFLDELEAVGDEAEGWTVWTERSVFYADCSVWAPRPIVMHQMPRNPPSL